jgi:hypothetical protein
MVCGAGLASDIQGRGECVVNCAMPAFFKAHRQVTACVQKMCVASRARGGRRAPWAGVVVAPANVRRRTLARLHYRGTRAGCCWLKPSPADRPTDRRSVGPAARPVGGRSAQGCPALPSIAAAPANLAVWLEWLWLSKATSDERGKREVFFSLSAEC